ncbi:rCG32086, partial [Rattus norvegicus]
MNRDTVNYLFNKDCQLATSTFYPVCFSVNHQGCYFVLNCGLCSHLWDPC